MHMLMMTCKLRWRGMNKQLLANTMVWHFNEVITESLAIILTNLREVSMG